MKFWFCEKCGKRITEADFPPGLDPEKVSGQVVCKACAAPAPAAGPVSTSKTRITRVSGSSHPATHATPHSHSAPPAAHKPSAAQTPAPASGFKANVILGAVGLVIVGVVVFLMMNISSGTHQPLAIAANAHPSTDSKTDLETQIQPATTGTSTSTSATTTAQPQTQTTTNIQAALPLNRPDPEQAANDAFDAIYKKLPALKADEKSAALEKFVNTYPDSIIAARANRMLQDVRVAAAESGIKSEPTAPVKPPEEPRQVPPPSPPEPPAKVEEPVKIDEGLAVYTAFQTDFLTALAGRDVDRAATLLKDAQKDPLLASRQQQITVLQPALDWIKELDAAPAKGAAMLKDVDSFTLPIAHGEPLRIGRSAPFKLDDFKDGVLNLSNKGLSLPVSLASLPDESRAKLAALALGEGGHARLVRALSELLAASDKQLESAVASVRVLLQREQKNSKAAAPASELNCLQQLAADAESAFRERVAAAAWKEIQNVELGFENAKQIATAIAAFKAAHGTTFFAMKNATEISAREAALNSVAIKGLIAYWKFDETEGNTAADSSDHKLTATLVNGVQWVAGKKGNAVSLNGVDQFIRLPEKLISSHTTISISIWFKTIAGGAILGYQSHPFPNSPINYVPALFVDAQGQLNAELWIGHEQLMRSGIAVNDGVWHHVVLNAQENVQTLYIDGTERATLKGNIDPLQMNSNQLGASFGNSWPNFKGPTWYFKGELDEIRFYDRVLTAAEIQQPAGK